MKEGWRECRLKDVAIFINGDRGKNYPSVKDFVDEGVPFINAGHIQGGHIDFSKMDYILPSKLNELRSGKVQKNDILFCLRGSLGKTTIVDIEDGAIASSLVIIRCQTINPHFLRYYLNSNKVFELILRNNNGSSQPNLSAKSVSNFSILVPPVQEQERIVAELDLLSGIIDKQKAQLKELDILAQSIFYDMFGNPVENEKGWEMSNLKKVCKQLFAGGDVPKDNYSDTKTEEFSIPILSNGVGEKALYGFTNKARVKEESITISGRGTIGYCEVREEPFFPVVRLIVATPNQEVVLPLFLKYVIDALHLNGIGVAIPQLTIPMVKDVEIILPPIELQSVFLGKIEVIKTQKEIISKSIVESQKLFDFTMDKYFS